MSDFKDLFIELVSGLNHIIRHITKVIEPRCGETTVFFQDENCGNLNYLLENLNYGNFDDLLVRRFVSKWAYMGHPKFFPGSSAITDMCVPTHVLGAE